MSAEEKCWSCKSVEPIDALKHMVGIGYACRDSAACRMRRDAASALPMPSPAKREVVTITREDILSELGESWEQGQLGSQSSSSSCSGASSPASTSSSGGEAAADSSGETAERWPLYEIDTDDVCTLEGFDGVGLMTGDVRDGLRMSRETARALADRLHAWLRATGGR